MKKFLILLVLVVLLSGCVSQGSIDDIIGSCGLPEGCIDPSESICVDQCGDGVCDEFVCQGEGCPCAETLDSCPADCQ